jgi:hypothetical protein
MFSVPFWFAICFVVGQYWPVSLVAAGLLAFAAVRWTGVVRLVCAALSCMLILCIVGFGFFVHGTTRAKKQRADQDAADRKRRTVTLASDALVAGISPPFDTPGTLPAGTTVEWGNDRHDFFYRADLHSPARFAGALWQGHLEHEAQGFWNGTLAGDQTFGTWHCAGGKDAEFGPHNDLMSCTLAQDFHAPRQVFPAGLELTIVSEIKFTVPEGGVLHLSEIDATLTPHQDVLVDERGNIWSIALNPFKQIQPDPVLPFRGVPVHKSLEYVYVHDDPNQALIGIRVDLSEELKCVGRTLPVDTTVVLPLTGNSLTLDSGQDRNQQVAGCLH